MLVKARIAEWTMTFSHVEVSAMNRFEMSFVAFEQVTLVVVGGGNKARRYNQVRIESAYRTCTHDVFVQPSAHATVGAP